MIKELTRLEQEGLISAQQSEEIREFYRQEHLKNSPRQRVIFGVLGALLVGLGIILILAHNWDELSRRIKTVLAFTPLVLSQIVGFWVLLKRADSKPFKETVAVLIYLSIGACISLVSQIYHLQGSVAGLLSTWILLGFALIYLFRSGMAAILHLVLSTFYAINTGYFSGELPAWLYWGFMLMIVPYYFMALDRNSRSNTVSFLNWLIPLSLTVSLGIITDRAEELTVIAYMLMGGIFYHIGNSGIFHRTVNNGWKIIGAIGSMGLLLGTTFEWLWEALERYGNGAHDLLVQEELFYIILLLLIGAFTFMKWQPRGSEGWDDPIGYLFIIFTILGVIGIFAQPVAYIAVNFVALGYAISYIRRGLRQNDLQVMNFGLIIFAGLVGCRYFDWNLSFTLRGILFILVGTGFFLSNWYLVRKKKRMEGGDL